MRTFEALTNPQKDDIVYERLAHVNYWYNGSYWVVLDPKYYWEPVMLLTDEAIAGLLKKVYAYEESPRTDIDISQVRKEAVHEQQESYHTSGWYRLAYSPVDTLWSNDVFYGSRNGVLWYWYR